MRIAISLIWRFISKLTINLHFKLGSLVKITEKQPSASVKPVIQLGSKVLRSFKCVLAILLEFLKWFLIQIKKLLNLKYHYKKKTDESI